MSTLKAVNIQNPFSATPSIVTNLDSSVLFGSGSGTNPSIGLGNTTTGIYSPSSNALGLSTGGNERIRVDSSGNVGIGTTNPQYKLDISGGDINLPEGNNIRFGGNSRIAVSTGGIQNLSLISLNPHPTIQPTVTEICTNSSSNTIRIAAGVNVRGGLIEFNGGNASVDAGTLKFFTGTTGSQSIPPERMRIDSSGNVGIGITTPGARLQVNGDVYISVRGSSYSFRTPDFRLYNTTTGNAFVVDNYSTEFLRIDSSGNLGIGTTSPTGKLTLIPTAPVSNNISTAVDWINGSYRGAITFSGSSFSYAGVGSNEIWYYSNGNVSALTFGSDGGVPIKFISNGSERLRITSSGNVGIGTTNPGNTLEVINSSTPIIRVGDGTRHFEVRGGSTTQNAAIGTNYNGAFDFIQNGAAAATIDVNKRLLVGTSASRQPAGFTGGGYLQLEGTTYQQASVSLINNQTTLDSGYLVFGKTRGTSNGSVTSVSNGDTMGSLWFQGADGTSLVMGAIIKSEVDAAPATGSMPGRLVFSTTASGASTPTERMRIDSAGNLLVGTNSTAVAQYGHTVILNGTATSINTFHGNGVVTGSSYHSFYYNTTNIGAIIQNGTTGVSYNTASDYRLKENVTSISDGITRLFNLKPSRFNFIADPGRTVDGFLAHEVQAVIPEAVTGEKDAIDENGNPIYQGIDQSKLVPLLTAALQEAILKIESLESQNTSLLSRIETLEAKVN